MSQDIRTSAPFGGGHAALAEAYRQLEYDTGALFEATNLPKAESREDAAWLDKGEWLSQAKIAGAQRVLFINDEPLIVFCSLSGDVSPQRELEAFRRVWCMGRPQRLFLALDDELRVYSLNRPPAANEAEWRQINPLVIVRDAAEVAAKLMRYRRARLEAGRLPADERFGDIDQRADKQLLHDLREVRRVLIAGGLKMQFSHALIGRSIFVRYLEDRGVLTPAFFEEVAGTNPAWRALLSEPPYGIQAAAQHRRYDRVLQDKDFAYAFFDALASHFNGDVFPSSIEERGDVEPAHLASLRDFLLGKGTEAQGRLLFWAYDFSIIPIELISNIYEEFYHEIGTTTGTGERDHNGTYYTPPTLVEFVLGQILTEERLRDHPRVLDPACGSGIFLVEAFRRMVRFEVRNYGRNLTTSELRALLRDRVVGVDSNREAARIAAFSLCLALLHYQEPPDILATRLPCLLHQPDQPQNDTDFHTIHCVNAFALTAHEAQALSQRIEEERAYRGRSHAAQLVRMPDRLEIEEGFDAVIGNPPWSEVAHDDRLPMLWAEAHSKVVGDRSYSQLFIHRATSLARPGGRIGILVHSSVLFNQRTTSQAFRKNWLASAQLHAVVNFVQVRRMFFERAVAPFVFLHFETSARAVGSFPYSTVRPEPAVAELRAVVLSKGDRRMVQQADLASRDYLWRTYMLGGHHDAAFLARLDLEWSLKAIRANDVPPGYGFQWGKQTPSPFLKQTRALASTGLRWYGPLRPEWFENPPAGTKRQPDERLYSGQRLLVTRGSKGSHGPYIRLETSAFSFRHTIYCIPLRTLTTSQAQVILAILWSSLAKYRMFMTSGTLAGWFDQMVTGDLLSMPVRFPESGSQLEQKILGIVATIRAWDASGKAPSQHLLDALDDTIFALFEMKDFERDLVKDFIGYSLSIIAQGSSSNAFASVDAASKLHWRGTKQDKVSLYEDYIEAFVDWWEPHLSPDGEFRWQVVRPTGVPMTAIVFSTQERGQVSSNIIDNDDNEWQKVLATCEIALRQPIADRLFVDAILRAVTPTDVIIVKRDEQRLWTRSVAREDAEAAFFRAMLAGEADPAVPA